MTRQVQTPGAGGFTFQPVGTISSPFKEKFGIPRQPGLMPAAEGRLHLLPPYDREEALRGLEGFSHLWLLFLFHGVEREEWRPTVRPPRLGGNERVGVFATRSTHRPNPIGMSVVELRAIVREEGKLVLELGNIDLMDGTPVLDIKPYIAYADAIPDARCGFAVGEPVKRPVLFSAEALAACASYREQYPQLATLIEQMLSLDPRPSYQNEILRRYGVMLYEFNVVWHFNGVAMVVEGIEKVSNRQF